jgi:hypothetical protein
MGVADLAQLDRPAQRGNALFHVLDDGWVLDNGDGARRDGQPLCMLALAVCRGGLPVAHGAVRRMCVCTGQVSTTRLLVWSVAELAGLAVHAGKVLYRAHTDPERAKPRLHQRSLLRLAVGARIR